MGDFKENNLFQNVVEDFKNQDLFDLIDEDKSGKISFFEFEQFITRSALKQPTLKINQMLDELDELSITSIGTNNISNISHNSNNDCNSNSISSSNSNKSNSSNSSNNNINNSANYGGKKSFDNICVNKDCNTKEEDDSILSFADKNMKDRTDDQHEEKNENQQTDNFNPEPPKVVKREGPSFDKRKDNLRIS